MDSNLETLMVLDDSKTEAESYWVDQKDNLNKILTPWWGWSGPITILPHRRQVLNISDMINPVIGANLCVNILFSGSMIPGWRSRRTSCMPRRPPTWISLERIPSSTAPTSGMSWEKCQGHRGQIQGHRMLTCILTNQEGQTACAAGGYRIHHNACARAAANHQGMRTDKERLMPKRPGSAH